MEALKKIGQVAACVIAIPLGLYVLLWQMSLANSLGVGFIFWPFRVVAGVIAFALGLISGLLGF